MDERGETLASVYMTSTPTAIVAESFGQKIDEKGTVEESNTDEDEDVWNHMEDADDSGEEGRSKKARR